MIRDLGTVRPGTKLYVPFHTFDSNDPSASVTISGLATTDIEIYKDGSTTQRASDAGYALLDTDGIDFDSVTGIHGVEIDLADNTTAGFFEAGSQYWVVIASITVDAATINFIPVTFRIGYEGAVLDTTIASLASQTSFTLEEGSADNDAYNGWTAVIHDVASAVQLCAGLVSDYVGSTKTITLSADPGIFTMAAGDNVSLFPPVGVHGWNAVALATTNPLPNAAAEASGGLFTRGTGAGQINQAANGQIDANTVHIEGSDATNQINAEIVDALAVDTISELSQAQPSATPTIASALMLLYMALRNKLDTTASTLEVHNDAGTVIAKKALSDDGTTYSEAKMVSGP